MDKASRERGDSDLLLELIDIKFFESPTTLERIEP
jgi:hypothetical protein